MVCSKMFFSTTRYILYWKFCFDVPGIYYTEYILYYTVYIILNNFLVALMFLFVWHVYRYTDSSSNHYSRCLQHLGKVFILCHSLICSGFEPFRLEEQLLSVEGAIFLTTNLETSLGNKENFSWSNLPQSLKTCLNLSSSL